MRIRMVTRTVVENKVTVKAYSIENDAIESINFSVIGDYTSKEVEKLAKEFTEDITEKQLKFICITNTEKTEQVYGMTEEEFVSLAKPITR